MTTNTNLRYTIEFFDASTAEDSDADPTFEATGMSLRELYVALAAHLGVLEIAVDYIDGTGDDMRYNVTSVGFPATSRGVVYVMTEELTPGA